MNIAEFCIRRKIISFTMIVLLAAGGIIGYRNLPRLEDPEFTVKDAIVVAPYPGASSAEVEEEVTDVLEKAIQQLGQLKRVESTSSRGMSRIKVKIKDQYDKNSLPDVWDELRRKLKDAEPNLPPGAGPIMVMDDFGDVYGVFLAITGDGYTYEELRRYADDLQRELLLCKDVKKITLYGLKPEAVFVEMSRSKMAALGISQEQIYSLLKERNFVADGKRIKVGREFLPVRVTGEFQDIKEIENLLISDSGSDSLVYLRDVANVRRGYQDPVTEKLRYDGRPAVGLAISTVLGGNVVAMGEAIEKRLAELEVNRPMGMEINVVSYQSTSVVEAINGFVINLIEAVAIVIAVLLIAMGVRSGLIIGAVLLLTIAGTLLVMDVYSITLERISLGALIIALGMLVDNAIVITEGMLIKIQKGEDRLDAARQVVSQNMLPLLGATVIAILAFGAIGLSEDSTGEYCQSLFSVLMISLGLSWVTAVTVTPLFCYMFLKESKSKDGGKDPYGGVFYRLYRGFVKLAIKVRWLTVAVLIGLLAAAIYGFGFVENSFFPDSTRPQFMIDVWLPVDNHIDDTEAFVTQIEAKLISKDSPWRKDIPDLENITHVSTCVGAGAPRFLLTYTPESNDSGYALLMVDVNDYKVIANLSEAIQEKLDKDYPQARCAVKRFRLGPGDGGRIQVRFRGPDGAILRQMGDEAIKILEGTGNVVGVRNDWRERIKTITVNLQEDRAQRVGITRPMVANAVQSAFEGLQVGVYRERDRLLPIIARSPERERQSVEQISDLQIWSPAAGKMIPIGQVISTEFDTVWENPKIGRRNRAPTVVIHCDPRGTTLPSDILDQTGDKLEAMYQGFVEKYNLGPEYSWAFGGEYEDSGNAQAALASSIPMFVTLMVLIVIFLFNSVRQPLIIWLCVPLAIIGVTAGLLSTRQPFGFMALLGMLSLSGMLIKNAIVLVDQIKLETSEGKDTYNAIVDSAVSRVRPVMMAVLTTVLGMTPLVLDAFYVAMAVTIMFGLTFSAVLTLVVVPVFYAIFYGAKAPKKVMDKAGE